MGENEPVTTTDAAPPPEPKYYAAAMLPRDIVEQIINLPAGCTIEAIDSNIESRSFSVLVRTPPMMPYLLDPGLAAVMTWPEKVTFYHLDGSRQSTSVYWPGLGGEEPESPWENWPKIEEEEPS